MLGMLEMTLKAADSLGLPAAEGLARMSDADFVRRASAHVGALIAARPELFPVHGPVRLFQDRDGGTRMLEALILRQPAERTRLLETCEVSHSALARAGLCSRAHVIRLLRDGEAQGLLTVEGGRITASRELSDDTERSIATNFLLVTEAARRALAGT
jgi:hypothetical protein